MKKRYIIIIPVLCLVLMTIIFRMIFFIGYVPSSSMEPTLKAGSVILGLRWHGELKNGDIIIFRRGDSLLIKRIAASQGDTISISGHMHTVPDNCYYVLGDNASNSYDSRYWKDPYINDADVVAKLIGL